jgi:hypothetical protein
MDYPLSVTWPDNLDEFGEFLARQGLTFERKGVVPGTGDILWQHGNSQLAVRVIADKGVFWSVRIADIAGWADQWYAVCELRDLISGERESCSGWTEQVGIAGQMRYVEQHWAEIVDLFAPATRTASHEKLKSLKKERAEEHWC